MKATLTRTENTAKHTLGKLKFEGHDKEFWTLELPWLDNAKSKSCIPAGTYPCIVSRSPHFGEVYHVQKVKARDSILIHVGNTTKDTHGCILVGLSAGHIDGKRAVLSSRQALGELYTLTGRKPFDLRIEAAD